MPSAFSVLLRRIARFAPSLFVVAALMAVFGFASRAAAQCTGTGTVIYASTNSSYNTGAQGVSVSGNASQVSTAKITVPSFPAGTTVTCVSVELDGVTSNGTGCCYSMDYANFLLTAPKSDGTAGGSQNLAFLGATGDGSDGSGLSNVIIAVADNASGGNAPFDPNAWSSASSFSVKPSSYHNLPANSESGGPPLPAGGNSSEWAQSDGSGTFANVFVAGGAPPAGAWTLSLRDDNGDPVSVTSWKLVMTTMLTSNVSTTTALASGLNPAFTANPNNSVTLTATVTFGTNSPVTSGTVTFSDGGTTLCSGKPLNGSGVATCAATFSTEGIHGLSASYSGATGYNSSSASGLNEYIKNHTSLNGGQYCNAGTISATGSTNPYPSVINVGADTSALGGSVAGVTVTLKNLSTTGLGDGYAFLLVAPDNSKAYNLDFLSSAGTTTGETQTLTIGDGNPSAPENGNLSGSYEATDYSSSADTFPASTSPAPAVPTGTINYPQPDFFGPGAKTFAQAFGNANGSGDWTLFAINSTGEPITVSGWCLAFEVNNGAITTTTLASSENAAFMGDSVKLTATVSSTSAVNSGTLSIVDNTTQTTLKSGTPSSGVVQVSTTTLSEGDHDIVATYSGVTNVFDPSSAELWQRVDKATTVSGNGTAISPAVYCNANGLTLPSQYISNNIGPASPNPSNIFTTNLPGTLLSVEPEMDGFQTADPVMPLTASLLVGPNNAGLDFWSYTGQESVTTLSSGNYDFVDGNSTLSQSNYGPGTYEPTSFDGPHTFFSSSSGFETLPGSYNYAQPYGNSTLDSTHGVFDGINGNGTWSLYFNQNIHDTGAGMTKWCLSFVETLPSVSPVATHAGSFIQGETGQTLTLNVTNEGNGPTGDPANTNPMTVVDTVPAGLAITGASGSGWTCGTAAQVVTCTTHATVNQGSGYPAITITTTVNANATTGPVHNSFSTSGGGANSSSSGNDTFNIEPAAVLSVTKAHIGTFTQGGSAEWDVTVNNTAAGGSTYGQVTVADLLPSGYTVSSFGSSGSNGWTCGGTNSVSCTTANTEPGGSSFPMIQMMVSVPATSPKSVTNTASAYGGGDLTHTNAGSAASGSDANVPVVQVPASIAVSSGNNQSAGLGTPFTSNLVALVTDAASVPIQGSSVTFAAPASGQSGTFTNTTTSTTATTDVNGLANSGTFTANAILGGYTVTASDSPAGSTSFSLTNIPGPAATLQLTGVPATAVSGVSFPFSVTAYDAYGNQATGYSGTLILTTSDPSAPALSPITMSGGAGSGSATLTTPGNQTVTATDSVSPGLTITSSPIAVSAPYLVVTTANDDASAPLAGNCTAQAAPGVGSDSNCSLRDALAYAANSGAGAISFNSTQFSTPQTIMLGADGTMTIPANTTISGPTSGSGYSLQNLVTIDGAGTYQIFISTGAASVSDLTIQNGNNAGGGAAIHHSGGTLTLTNCTIQNNAASKGDNSNGYGGAVQGPGALTVNNCTFSGNSAGAQGGAIYQSAGALTIANSTFYNNSAHEAGAIYFVGSTGSIADSSIAGNTAGSYGGAIENFGALTMNNSILSGNNSGAGGAILNRDDSSGTLNADSNVFYNNTNPSPAEVDISCGSGTCAGPSTTITNSTSAAVSPVAALASYGGPTQTMLPLPDSGAICSASKNDAIAAGIVADQRGLALDQNCNNGEVDAGAVQTNYAFTFIVQPPVNAIVGVAMMPAPEVHLTENGQAAVPPTTSIAMSDSTSSVGGTTAVPLYLSSATFTNLVFSSTASGDLLTATLPLNSSLAPPVSLTAQSNAVNAFNGAMLTSPSPGSTLAGPSVAFSWSTAAGATGYQFWLGTTGRGSNNLYSSGETMGTGFTSITVNNLPTDGSTVFARLFTNISGTWVRIDYTFTAATQAAITSPVQGSTLSGFSTTFNWTAGVGATPYRLWVGTGGVNSNDLYASGLLTGTSATVKIPANGEEVFARLYVQFNGTWTHLDYTYTAPTLTQGAITSPTPSTTLTQPFANFAWSAGIGATGYELWLGSTGVNSNDLYSSGEVSDPTFLSVGVPSLPTNGSIVYARLYTDFNGTWLHTDYTYTAASSPAIASPAPGSTINGYSATFTWSPGTGVTAYQLWVGNTGKASSNFYTSGVVTGTSAMATHLPYDGSTLNVRLYSEIGGVWNHIDYTYTAGSAPALTTPTPGTTLGAAPVTFTWSAGTGVTGYRLWLGTTGVNSSDVYAGGVTTSTSAQVNSLPSSGQTVYARLYFQVNGVWYHTDYTYIAP